MLAVQGAVQHAASIRALIVLLAILTVMFWRSAIKLAIMIVAILVLVLITSGALTLLASAQHVIK